MSFRAKTILGIAAIEAVMLLFLVWSSLGYLAKSNQEELARHALSTVSLFASVSKDAVLSTDLAKLNDLVAELVRSEDVVYVRVRDEFRILSQGGDSNFLNREFISDFKTPRTDSGSFSSWNQSYDEETDGVFDISAPIGDSEYYIGEVQLGLTSDWLSRLLNKARTELLTIALAEMLLVALFSYFLGLYLTRGVQALTKGAVAVRDGALGVQIPERGEREVRIASRAFNTMSQQLARSNEAMRHSVDEAAALAAKLRERESHLRTILDNAVDGIITIDEGCVIRSVNPAGARIFGYEVSELLGQDAGILVGNDGSSANVGQRDSHAPFSISELIGTSSERLGLHKDGSGFSIDLAVSKMPVGDRTMYVGLVRDISERLRVEHEARKDQAFKTAVLESSLDALLTIDTKSHIVEFSGVAEEMFQYPRDEVIGKSVVDLIIPPRFQQRHRQGMEHYLSTGVGPVLGRRIELQAMRRGGEEFPIELTIAPIDIGGEKLFTSLIRDISERKAAETQLVEAKRKAELASDAKSRFLAHMSHEIRSPLSATIGSVELLLDSELNKQQRLYADTARAAGKSLLALVNDVLDFSKIEAGQLVVERRQFDPRSLAREIIEIGMFRNHGGDVQIGGSVSSQIPSALIGDPGRLRQVVSNLLDNALKFTQHGAVVLRITQEREEENTRWINFEIVDSGIGIEAADQALLFDEFSQVDDSDASSHPGTGLGLAICKGLVDLMGGTLSVTSEVGQGSCFRAQLPFGVVVDEQATTEPIVSTAGKRMLAVGLHPLMGDALQDYAFQLGLSIDLDADLAHGCARLRRNRAGGETYHGILISAASVDDHVINTVHEAAIAGIERKLVVLPLMVPGTVTPVIAAANVEHLMMPLMMDDVVTKLLENNSDEDFGKTTSRGLVEQKPGQSTDLGSRPRILLAEDSAANRMVAMALLDAAGYDVEVAENGREAVEACAQKDYDLVLMDLRMPQMTGLEATEIIRNSGTTVPIIALTANALEEDIQRCLAAGMDDYVTKPIDKERLIEALSAHIKPQHKSTIDDNSGRILVSDVAPDDGLALLDEETISLLERDTSAEAVPAMMSAFMVEVRQRIGTIERALPAPPLDMLELEAHTIKSCAATFGALRLSEAAKAVESECRQGRGESARRLAHRLPELLADTESVYLQRFGAGTET